MSFVELRHLRYLVAIADEGSISRASARLHVAQQALSRQIADLEHELGVRLFVRHARGVRLTSRGAAFAEDARHMLAEASRAVLRVRSADDECRQSLRITYTPAGRTEEYLAELLRRFAGARPQISPQCDPLTCQAQVGALRDRTVDVGFLFVPPDTDEFDKAVAWVLSFDRVLLPSEHPLACRDPLWLRDLEPSPMLWSPREPYQSVLAALADRGIRPAFASFRVSRTSPALVAGIGAWALVPGDGPCEAGAVRRTFADPPIEVPQWAVWRRDEASAAVHQFVATCTSIEHELAEV